jgi:recombination protein RecR
VQNFAKLPGIGEKSAYRLAYYLLKQNESFAEQLASSILEAKTKTKLCAICFDYTESSVCRICSDSSREDSPICVVERPSDVTVLSRNTNFRGKFHVLHGLISPLEGISPDDLKMRELLNRVNTALNNGVSVEVILATNPSVEGDATAIYLARLLKGLGVRVTKLASGIPMGGVIEFTDSQTLARALENRTELR